MLIDDSGVHLIDGGFIGGVRRIHRELRRRSLDWSDVRSIVLTHGHLDHTLNIARLQKLTNSPISAPKQDAGHILGGASRFLCEALEKAGRFLFRYRSPVIDHWLEDGDHVSGMRVVALPGHTVGHCGFLLENERLLIAGDLFTQHLRQPSPPPAVFNDDHTEALRSIRKAAEMDLQGVFLNHTKKMTPTEGLAALQKVAKSYPP